jgi:predicted O-methyltransferase YrrM
MKRAYVAAVKAVTRKAPFEKLTGWSNNSRRRTWLVSLLAIHDFDRMRALGWPWWTFDAAQLVREHLESVGDARVFEWGSGASTLWLAARAAEVHSVEHDPQWAALVQEAAPDHVEVTTVPPTRPPAGHVVVGSHKRGYEGLDFTEYCAAIDAVSGVFDLIVIDGRAREACLSAAIPRLAPRGVIVFDNVDRHRYVEAIDQLGEQVRVTMTQGLTPALPYPTRTALISVNPTP